MHLFTSTSSHPVHHVTPSGLDKETTGKEPIVALYENMFLFWASVCIVDWKGSFLIIPSWSVVKKSRQEVLAWCHGRCFFFLTALSMEAFTHCDLTCWARSAFQNQHHRKHRLFPAFHQHGREINQCFLQTHGYLHLQFGSFSVLHSVLTWPSLPSYKSFFFPKKLSCLNRIYLFFCWKVLSPPKESISRFPASVASSYVPTIECSLSLTYAHPFSLPNIFWPLFCKPNKLCSSPSILKPWLLHRQNIIRFYFEMFTRWLGIFINFEYIMIL